ncbi:hypothetical protein [uncultured Gulosibacter sp.]|uniref:hypothetical protein n=1 Tax=uncultured Gulosibacter sp. TaxID=1339167 RepID=UPI00288A1DCF|nr:hypothetical protein [uncultured Gulosibacter sp.]
MEPLNINPDRIRQQAAATEHALSALDEAQSAVSSINLSGGAFGIMCSFLIPPAQVVTSATSFLLGNAHGMLEREAQALRDFADDLVSCDEEFESKFGAVEIDDVSEAEYWR